MRVGHEASAVRVAESAVEPLDTNCGGDTRSTGCAEHKYATVSLSALDTGLWFLRENEPTRGIISGVDLVAWCRARCPDRLKSYVKHRQFPDPFALIEH